MRCRPHSEGCAVEDMKALNKEVEILQTDITVIKGKNESKFLDLKETVVDESYEMKTMKKDIVKLKSEN